MSLESRIWVTTSQRHYVDLCSATPSENDNFCRLRAVEPPYDGHPGAKLTSHCTEVATVGKFQNEVYGSAHSQEEKSWLLYLERWPLVEAWLYLCLNSWKSILLGKPWRQILIPSSTPLHLSWSNTSCALILPALRRRGNNNNTVSHRRFVMLCGDL